MHWGANAIYDIVDGKFQFSSYYKVPAPQSEQENCVAHNGSIVPVPGRDIFAQAWYQGGLSVLDFTDTENPVEIAYFDRGPIHEERMVIGGYWSTYWYNGKIYGTEIIRGLDVMALEPSEFLSENEIAAAQQANMGDVFNPQQQFPVTWPSTPIVALAYLDQLQRANALEADSAEALYQVLGELKQNGENTAAKQQLGAMLSSFSQTANAGQNAAKLERLLQTLKDIAGP
jgi:hypothetical protein